MGNEFGGALDAMRDAAVEEHFDDSDERLHDQLLDDLLEGKTIPKFTLSSVWDYNISEILEECDFDIAATFLKAHKEGRENIYHDIVDCLNTFIDQNWQDIKRGIEFERESDA